MREKNWLLKVLEEASERVEAWPDWKKSKDLQDSEENGQNRNGQTEGATRQFRCA